MLFAYKWMVVCGALAMAFMGFGIGANDVANNFGSSVGSGAIRLPQAVLIAGICEFLGAVALGSSVTESVRGGVVDFSAFENQPDIILFGNLCALVAAGLCLLSATYFGTPVSTTHTIVGALVGFGLATGRPNCVDWKYVGFLVASWVCSPILAGLAGATLFGLTRQCILRKPNPVKLGLRWLWLLVALVCISFAFFFIYSNPMQLNNISCSVRGENGQKIWIQPCDVPRWVHDNPGPAIGLSFGLAICLTLGLAPLAYWRAFGMLKKYDDQQEGGTVRSMKTIEDDHMTASYEDTTKEQRDTEDSTREYPPPSDWMITCEPSNCESSSHRLALLSCKVPLPTTDAPPFGPSSPSPTVDEEKDEPIDVRSAHSMQEGTAMTTLPSCPPSTVPGRKTLGLSCRKLPWNVDICQDALEESEEVATIHTRAELFDSRAEKFFSFLQVISAITSCLVHGANDVANATGPFASIYDIYHTGKFNATVGVSVWILAIGGVSIALGLAILGHRVIQTLGVKMVKITPSRGFSIELGMTLTMLIGTNLGIPLSTTQCQVGSTIGVGLLDKVNDNEKSFLGLNLAAINTRLLIKVFISWIVALLFAAVVSAGIFAFASYGPTLSPYYKSLVQ